MEWQQFTPEVFNKPLENVELLLRIENPYTNNGAYKYYHRLVKYDPRKHCFTCHSHCELQQSKFHRITHFIILTEEAPCLTALK
jgi:hypothetical protein